MQGLQFLAHNPEELQAALAHVAMAGMVLAGLGRHA